LSTLWNLDTIHTYLYINLFTKWQNLISVIDATINCNDLYCCTDIDLYSAWCDWDILYTNIFVFLCTQKFRRSVQIRTRSLHFILLVMVPLPAILYFPWCKSFRWPGSLNYRGFTITLRHTTLSRTSLEVCSSIAWRNNSIAEKYEGRKEIYGECQNAKLSVIWENLTRVFLLLETEIFTCAMLTSS